MERKREKWLQKTPSCHATTYASVKFRYNFISCRLLVCKSHIYVGMNRRVSNPPRKQWTEKLGKCTFNIKRWIKKVEPVKQRECVSESHTATPHCTSKNHWKKENQIKDILKLRLTKNWENLKNQTVQSCVEHLAKSSWSLQANAITWQPANTLRKLVIDIEVYTPLMHRETFHWNGWQNTKIKRLKSISKITNKSRLIFARFVSAI